MLVTSFHVLKLNVGRNSPRNYIDLHRSHNLGTKGGTGRNEQATCVVESYLRAANISHTPLPDGGISVMTPAGDEVHVVFATGRFRNGAAAPSKYPTISVNPETVLTTKKDMTMSVFHEITEKAGHGRPVPVERGPEPIGVVNDFFLVSIRHRDFRTVPNPPDEELRAHEKLITDICTKFHSRFQWLCSKKGYGVGDLKTFALAWATIFLGKYKRTRRSRVENEKLLRAHIEKRLWGEFAPRLQRDLRIDHIDTETYQVATTGDVEGVREEDEEKAWRPIELDLSDDEARRKSARSMLVSKLRAAAPVPGLDAHRGGAEPRALPRDALRGPPPPHPAPQEVRDLLRVGCAPLVYRPSSRITAAGTCERDDPRRCRDGRRPARR
jgi:hypothetical protein